MATIICTLLHVYTIASTLPRGSSRGRVAPMAPETCPQCHTPRESADFAFCTNCGAPFAAGGTQPPVEEAGTQVLPQQPWGQQSAQSSWGPPQGSGSEERRVGKDGGGACGSR